MIKHMDHNEYPKRLKTKSTAALMYIIKDAREAIAAYPDSKNAGYYADEIHYAAMEWQKRRS